MFSIRVSEWKKTRGRIFMSGRQSAALADVHCDPLLNWNGHVVTKKKHLHLAHQRRRALKKQKQQQTQSCSNVQEPADTSETVEGVCDESLVCATCRGCANNDPFQLRSRKGRRTKRLARVSSRTHTHTHASPIIRGAEQALNYRNLLAHKSFASQNKTRQQSSLCDLRLAEVGQQGPPPAHMDKYIDAVPPFLFLHNKEMRAPCFLLLFWLCHYQGKMKAQVDQ